MSEYLRSGDPFLIDLWYDTTGRHYPLHYGEMPSLQEVRATQWDNEFEKLVLELLPRPIDTDLFKLAKNRMVMGGLRYGLIKDQDYNKYDLPEIALRKYSKYCETDNLEYLVDCYNNLMLAFIHGKRYGEIIEKLDDARTFTAFLYNYIWSKNIYYLVQAAVEIVLEYYMCKKLGKKVRATDDQDHGKEIVQ